MSQPEFQLEFQPQSTNPVTKNHLLARTIADAFGDSKQANTYISHCHELPLSVVLQAYTEAKSFPLNRIRKPQAALFFYLIKRIADERK